MLRTILLVAILVLSYSVFAFAAPDGAMTVSTTALEPLTRPAAAFDHDAHNEKAGLEECVACHHSEADGKQSMEESSEGTPCADCHALEAKDGRTPLVRAYHLQCISCHKDKNVGPTNCGGCHKPW